MQEMEGAVTYDNDNRSENKNVLKNNFWHKCSHTKTQGHTDKQILRYVLPGLNICACFPYFCY